MIEKKAMIDAIFYSIILGLILGVIIGALLERYKKPPQWVLDEIPDFSWKDCSYYDGTKWVYRGDERNRP